MKIRSRTELFHEIIRDATKYPNNWKAVLGKDRKRLSNDYYIFNPNIGIYLLKEYQKNPFEVTGIGGKIARHVDEDIENEITKYSSDFGIIQGDIKRIIQNIEKGVSPQKIFEAALRGRGKNLGIKIPVKGHASSSKDSFTNVQTILSNKQKKLDIKFEKIAADHGLYTSYG